MTGGDAGAFAALVPPDSPVVRLAGGMAWAEGPVWFGDGRFLLWSDIPNNRVMRWCAENGAVSVFRAPSHFANGHSRDRRGRLVTCEHETRRVTRTEHDGTITVLAARAGVGGGRLNSPNDVVCASDGSVWFTDPDYGLRSVYEGGCGAAAEATTNLYRIDPAGGIHLACTDFANPNGLCFSPDETILYVIETGAVPNRIWACMLDDGRCAIVRKSVLVTAGDGELADGLRCDAEGRLWCGWGGGAGRDGVTVFTPAGVRLGHIPLPERCANLCFGGVRGNRLFMAATHSLYALHVNVRGDPGPGR